MVIEGERIRAVVPRTDVPGVDVRDLGGGLLAPGFIDVQVNGGGGALLNDNPTVETVRTIAAVAPPLRHGRDCCPPSSPMRRASSGRRWRAWPQAMAQKVPGVLGIHIEGPFLDVARKGAHAARFIREMEQGDVEELAGFASRMPVMLTLAPNRVKPGHGEGAVGAGVLVSLGHSDASYDEARQALDAGARAFTHLYNAMSQMNGREPGMVGAALSDAESYVGIIADGHHVHDAALRVAFAAKNPARMMLITDAMPTAAGGPSSFELQGRKVTAQRWPARAFRRNARGLQPHHG